MKAKTTKVKPESRDPRAIRSVRFPGITRDAERLGVNRVTLYRVLTGKWKLPTLRQRYQDLKGE